MPGKPHPDGLLGVVVVTGTDTGVGKTITTAAIAAAATACGYRVGVVKPAQTGMLDASLVAPAVESDVEVVLRLAAPADARTVATYPEALAPAVAARIAGRQPLELAAVLDVVAALRRETDLVLIEGAGGLLVPMGEWTIADLAVRLEAPAVVVARAGLGTLNHTALTMEALARRDVSALVVLGAWPAEPALVHRTNLAELSGELAGVLPEGAGLLAPATFRASAPSWLTRRLHGQLTIPALELVG
jgi:dethiobiotin synthetase